MIEDQLKRVLSKKYYQRPYIRPSLQGSRDIKLILATTTLIDQTIYQTELYLQKMLTY